MPVPLSTAVDPTFQALNRSVANTPLLAIRARWAGRDHTIYAKLESLSLTGSIKDRMALHILRRAYADGALRPGDVIAEASSGNSGIAFAAVGRALGHPVTIFMPDWMSRERMALLQSYGATIVPVSEAEGGFLGAIEQAEGLGADGPGVFLPRQFSNRGNSEAHFRTTGPEIWYQLAAHGRAPDAFVAGVGTGGTVMGVGEYLRSRKSDVRVHPLEPAESPTLSTGHRVGHHRIQGISDEFVPDLLDLAALDRIVAVPDGDAILMAQALARDLGLAVGISSGANVVGALRLQHELGGEACVVTVLPDDNRKYLSTDLLREEPTRDGYLTPQVRLAGYDVYRRACRTCSDLEECEHWPPERCRSAGSAVSY